MNQSREALRVSAVLGLIFGGLTTVIALIVYAVAANGELGPDRPTMAGATGWAYIGAYVLAFGPVAMLVWFLAASIEHGQKAIVDAVRSESIAEESTRE